MFFLFMVDHRSMGWNFTAAMLDIFCVRIFRVYVRFCVRYVRYFNFTCVFSLFTREFPKIRDHSNLKAYSSHRIIKTVIIPLMVYGGDNMKQQSASNHTRYQPLQQFIWLPLSVVLLLSTIGYVIYRIASGTFSAALLLLLGAVVLAIIPGMLARIYALTLQDRLIRTEEQLRYYMLTNQRIDARITMKQLIALRFASDEEYVALVEKTVKEDLSPEEIKAAIKSWRADHQRV